MLRHLRDHLQTFVLVSKDEINTYEIEFVKESKSAIGFNKTAFRVAVRSSRRLKESLTWNKAFEVKYNYKNPTKSWFLIHNNHSCVLYGLDAVEYTTTMKDLIKNENIISSATYSSHYNYLIIG